uniref:Uncharacterized protein n=2 Tax=Athene cunicularia TaxID=194338 RepID=A0A663ME86_ATHCN
MPWVAVPYADEARRSRLNRLYGIQGIPTLIVLDSKGDVITRQGRVEVLNDIECREFPWHPKPVLELTDSNAVQLNEGPCLVLFVGTERHCSESRAWEGRRATASLARAGHRAENLPLVAMVSVGRDVSPFPSPRATSSHVHKGGKERAPCGVPSRGARGRTDPEPCLYQGSGLLWLAGLCRSLPVPTALPQLLLSHPRDAAEQRVAAERSCPIKAALVAAVEGNADRVLGSTRNTLSQPVVVVETGKAAPEQGPRAHVTRQKRLRERL